MISLKLGGQQKDRDGTTSTQVSSIRHAQTSMIQRSGQITPKIIVFDRYKPPVVGSKISQIFNDTSHVSQIDSTMKSRAASRPPPSPIKSHARSNSQLSSNVTSEPRGPRVNLKPSVPRFSQLQRHSPVDGTPPLTAQ